MPSIVVIDTSVFVRALTGSKTSRALLDAAVDGLLKITTSEDLFNELVFTLKKPGLKKLIPESEIGLTVAFVKKSAVFVNPSKPIKACRDDKDNPVLACALEAKADVIASTDKDLLCMDSFENIPILHPHFLLKLLG